MGDLSTGRAGAKVNLVLEVLGVRGDGYHEVDTILQELELADAVAVEPAAEWSISVGGPRALGTPADETNLAMKAARLLATRVGGTPVAITLEKHIPAAGGLGGGASDAAAVLRLLCEVWPGVTPGDLRFTAEAVGSDEVFFLAGGTARAQGRGERVTRLTPLPQHDVVLFIPRRTIDQKTPRMFAALDRYPFDSGSVAEQFARERPQRVSNEVTFNAFERVAFELFPWLAALWRDLEERIGEAVRLAGAGPCLFWIGKSGRGETVAAKAAGADCEVISTRTVSPR